MSELEFISKVDEAFRFPIEKRGMYFTDSAGSFVINADDFCYQWQRLSPYQQSFAYRIGQSVACEIGLDSPPTAYNSETHEYEHPKKLDRPKTLRDAQLLWDRIPSSLREEVRALCQNNITPQDIFDSLLLLWDDYLIDYPLTKQSFVQKAAVMVKRRPCVVMRDEILRRMANCVNKIERWLFDHRVRFLFSPLERLSCWLHSKRPLPNTESEKTK